MVFQPLLHIVPVPLVGDAGNIIVGELFVLFQFPDVVNALA